MEKIAVVQIDITTDVPDFDMNRRNEKLKSDSIAHFRIYAATHDYDHHYFTEPKFPGYHPQLEIFRVLDMDYDRIITVDTDVLIHNNADIIEHSHPTGLTACLRPDGGNSINSGVLVWGREARDYYRAAVDIDRAASFKNRDQDEINLISNKYPAHRISHRFNDYTLHPDSYWHHYKGGLKQKYSSSR